MRIDTLSAYETLLESGIEEKQAKIQARLIAKAGEPEIDLQIAFANIDNKFAIIDNKFSMIDLKFASIDKHLNYLTMIGIGIIVAVIAQILKGLF